MPDEMLIETTLGAVAETATVGALLEKEPSRGKRHPAFGVVCSNCHAELRGRHCHYCGQVADTFHRPVWSLFAEIVEGYLGLDGRIWYTLPALLFRPGHITARYLRGIRQPYVTPFRLFLLSSLLFFLFFAVLMSGRTLINAQGIENLSAQDSSAAIETTRSTLESARFSFKQRALCALRKGALPEDLPSELCIKVQAEQASQIKPSPETGEQTPQPAGASNRLSIEAAGIQKVLSVETRRFLVGNIETAVNDPAQYQASLGRWAPRLVFVLAPAYGLILALSFFWRRDIFIYDHMVVALHFHAFLFLFLVLLMPVGLLVGPGLAVGIFALWSNYYLYRVHRRVYRCRRFGAIVRVLALDFIYFLLLTTAFFLLLVLGIIFV